VCTIGDIQGFSGIAPIVPTEGFSIEILIEVSLSWKMEFPDCCTTTTQVYCKEGGHCRRWAFRLDVDKEYHCRNVFSR